MKISAAGEDIILARLEPLESTVLPHKSEQGTGQPPARINPARMAVAGQNHAIRTEDSATGDEHLFADRLRQMK
jgi:hypothetical protein